MRCLRSNALHLVAAVLLLQLCALGAHGQAAETQQRLFVPWANLALDVELPGLVIDPYETTEESAAKTAAAANVGKQATGNGPAPRVREFFCMLAPGKEKSSKLAFLRIRMEPSPDGAGAEALRASVAANYVKNNYVRKESVREDVYKQTPLLKFKLSEKHVQAAPFFGYVGGLAVPVVIPGLFTPDRGLEAFVVRDGAALSFRFMSSEIKEKEEQFFYSILDSLRFVDASKPSSSSDYFALGRDLYRRKENGAAAAALEEGLALEQKRRELPQEKWRELVMTLANAHGRVNQVERAREVLEYGIAADPTYPFFHYGLSHLYAYLRDLERTLSELEKTYQLVPKGKNAPGGWIPDPLEDPGYVKFAGDPRFSDAVKALKKRYKN